MGEMARGAHFRLLKTNTAWLYATEFLSRLVGLLVVPIWSSRVAPDEYARWILALTSTEMLLEVGGVGLGSFLTKVLYRYRDDRAERYFGMGAGVMIGATALGALAMAMFSPWLSRTVIGGDARPDLFVFLALYLVLAQFTRVTYLYLESRVQYGACFVLRMLRLIFYTGLLLYFLLGRGQGFYSWVWAALGTELLLLSPSAYQLRRVRWRWPNRRMLAFALRFSFPSLATNLLGWGQSRAGRYVLSFSGLSVGVGLYGLAQSFAQNYGAAIRPAKIVSLRVLGHVLEDDADSPYFLEFFHGFACLALAAAFVVAMFLGDIMKLLVAPAYYRATVALPPLVFALYFQEVYSLYHSLMFRYFRVWFQFWGVLIAFVTVMATMIALMPLFGFVGAAVAELVGATAMAVFAHIYAITVSPRQFRFGEKMGFSAAALALVAVAEALAIPLLPRIGLAIVALAAYALFYWRRRRELFPVAAGVARVSSITHPSPIPSRPA